MLLLKKRYVPIAYPYQAETVNSMMKRNLGSALGGKTARSRQRDMLLNVLTHDLMVV